jgi:Flp pilus assembly protein TadB
MTTYTVLAALSGGLVTAGILLVIAAIAGFDPLPSPTVKRSPLRAGHLRSRRTLLDVGLALAAGTVAWVATGWPVAALGVAVAVVALPRLLGGRAARRRIGRLEALETWVRELADILAAGRGIEEAILVAAERPPEPIAAEIVALRRRLEFRTPTEEAIRAFADDLNLSLGDTIAAALIIASQRGRGLHEILTALADTVARDVAMQREIDAERASHRTTAVWVVVALGLYTGFAILNRAYVAPFDTFVGQVMLAVVALLYTGTLLWLHRLASPAPGFRFLPPPKDRR